MASVRMSGELRDSIRHNGSNLFTKSLEKAQARIADDFYDRLMDDLYEKEFGPYKKYLNKVPESWTKHISGIYAHIKGNVDGQWYEYMASSNDTVKRYRIPLVSEYYNYSGQFNKDDLEPSEPIFKEFHIYNARINKIREEQTKFNNSLNEVLNRCNTLKQFIDVWPHAENIIPQDALDKLKEPSPQRAAAERIDPEVSTEINSILVKRTILDSRD